MTTAKHQPGHLNVDTGLGPTNTTWVTGAYLTVTRRDVTERPPAVAVETVPQAIETA